MSIVRTKTKATGGITEEEERLLAEHSKLWISRAFRTEPIQHDKITSSIERLYAVSGLKKPRVVIVSSPLVMAFAGGFSAAIWYLRKDCATHNATHIATRRATDDATDSATHNATYNATRRATADATDIATRSATTDATHNATHNATWPAALALVLAGSSEGAKYFLGCARNWSRMYQGGNMWSAWACYLSAFRDIIGLELKEHEAYSAWEDCAIHGGFRMMHEEFCIVSDFPEYIKIDDSNLPHCLTGPSHKWRDGWSLYHWHGVAIPGEWTAGVFPSAKDMLHWPNIEQRRAGCSMMGWAKILDELDAKVIDQDGDPEIGTLFECDLPDSGRELFLKVRCATGREFALIVTNSKAKTALEAQEWMFPVPPEVGKYIKPQLTA